MTNHIDLSTVLRQTVSCELYSNLVTRPTGAAVRNEIERLVSETRERSLTIIDFSHVSMIDFSCADEVIAKLMLRFSTEQPPRDAYFLFRGLTEDHWDAIEAVLERHELALPIEQGDAVRLVGFLPERERRVWECVYRVGSATSREIAVELLLDEGAIEPTLVALCRRRLLMRLAEGYVAVGGNRG